MKKVLFCGFGILGKKCLEKLHRENYEIVCILTHKEEAAESVDTYAIQENIKYSYDDARKHLETLSNLIGICKPDVLISVNYRYIIPKEIFGNSQYAINIHGSLLPEYRGRTPHVWSIINGEKFSGITCHIMEETVDTGDIIEQIKVEISCEDTGHTLLEKFHKLYPGILLRSLKKLEKEIPLIKQDESRASYYGKRTADMGYIDFQKKAKGIIDFVRAQARPYPGAYCYLKNGHKIIIDKIGIEEIDIPLSKIGIIEKINGNYYVKCEDKLLKLQLFDIVD